MEVCCETYGLFSYLWFSLDGVKGDDIDEVSYESFDGGASMRMVLYCDFMVSYVGLKLLVEACEKELAVK